VSGAESPLERDLDTGAARVNPETGEFYATTSWAVVDLEPYKRGERIIEAPAFLHRTDGKALIYPGRPHVFFGESESLKTFAALLACRTVVEQGLTVVYVDMEASEASFVERARLVGIADGFIGDALKYIRPIEPLAGDAQSDFFLHELELAKPALVVLDGVTELFALQGWDPNKATDAAQFQRTFGFRGLCASIAIDHTAKDAGRGVFGSQHKRAGLDGAEYEFKPVIRRGRGGESIAKVTVTKDRHGHVREWVRGDGYVGSLHVGKPDGPDRVVLEPPTLKELIDPKSDAQDRALEYIRANPGSSKRQVRDGAGLGDEQTSEALSGLAMLGKIENRGSKSQHKWFEVGP
jgi:hypothetical protein